MKFNFSKIIFAIVFLFFSASLFSQKAEKELRAIGEMVEKNESIHYYILYFQKFLSEKDTTVYEAEVYLKRVYSDSFGYYLNIYHPEWESRQIYDGKTIAWIDYKNKVCMLTDVAEYGTGSMDGNVTSNFIIGRLMKKERWTDFISDPEITKMEFTSKKGISHFTIQFKDGEEIKNNSIDITFNKKTSAYYFSEKLDFEGMHQYRELITDVQKTNFNTDTLFHFEKFLPAGFKVKNYSPGQPVPLLENNKFTPSWKLTDLDGKEVHIDSLFGKVILLDFWYRSCYPCMKLQPFLQQLHDEYKDKGLVVLGVNPFDKDDELLREFIAGKKMSYPVLLNAKEVSEMYNVSGYPTLYLISKEGKIAKTHVGYSEHFTEEIKPVIDSLLKAKVSPYLNEIRFGKRPLTPDYYFNFRDTVFENPEKSKIIPHIYFDFDKYTLRPESFVMLDSLADYMTENPGIIFCLEAHTDGRSSDKYSIKLSQRRAQAVVDYMISKGINPKRMVASGYDRHKPLILMKGMIVCNYKTDKEVALDMETIQKIAPDKNSQECFHQLNRRIAIRILATNFKN